MEHFREGIEVVRAERISGGVEAVSGALATHSDLYVRGILGKYAELTTSGQSESDQQKELSDETWDGVHTALFQFGVRTDDVNMMVGSMSAMRSPVSIWEAAAYATWQLKGELAQDEIEQLKKTAGQEASHNSAALARISGLALECLLYEDATIDISKRLVRLETSMEKSRVPIDVADAVRLRIATTLCKVGRFYDARRVRDCVKTEPDIHAEKGIAYQVTEYDEVLEPVLQARYRPNVISRWLLARQSPEQAELIKAAGGSRWARHNVMKSENVLPNNSIATIFSSIDPELALKFTVDTFNIYKHPRDTIIRAPLFLQTNHPLALQLCNDLIVRGQLCQSIPTALALAEYGTMPHARRQRDEATPLIEKIKDEKAANEDDIARAATMIEGMFNYVDRLTLAMELDSTVRDYNYSLINGRLINHIAGSLMVAEALHGETHIQEQATAYLKRFRGKIYKGDI